MKSLLSKLLKKTKFCITGLYISYINVLRIFNGSESIIMFLSFFSYIILYFNNRATLSYSFIGIRCVKRISSSTLQLRTYSTDLSSFALMISTNDDNAYEHACTPINNRNKLYPYSKRFATGISP